MEANALACDTIAIEAPMCAPRHNPPWIVTWWWLSACVFARARACSIANSSSLVDDAINQASETRLALERQKKILLKGSSSLSQLMGTLGCALDGAGACMRACVRACVGGYVRALARLSRPLLLLPGLTG